LEVKTKKGTGVIDKRSESRGRACSGLGRTSAVKAGDQYPAEPRTKGPMVRALLRKALKAPGAGLALRY